MKKTLLIMLTLVLALSVLAGCGPDRSEEPANQPPANGDENALPEKPEKLVIWMNDEERQVKAIEDIGKKYTEQTGIEVEVVAISMLDQIKKLDLDGPAGKGPDIFFQPHDRVGDVATRGLADPLDISDVKDQYTETAINAVTFNGETYGIPAVVETYALYYNKQLVDKAPETMEELMAIAESDTNTAEGKYGFLMEANNFYYVYPFFAGYGGYVFNYNNGTYDTTDIGLNNEGAVKGGELIQSWFTNGYIPKEINADILNGLFKDGKASAVINGPWMIREYSETLGENLGTAPLPTLENGEHPKSFVGVKTFMLSYYSENKYWAQDLMKFMTNKENALYYYENAGEMPARKDTVTDPLIADDPIIAAFAEQATYGEPMPGVPEMQQVWEPMNNTLQFIANGDSPEEVLNEAVQMIQDNIAASKQ